MVWLQGEGEFVDTSITKCKPKGGFAALQLFLGHKSPFFCRSGSDENGSGKSILGSAGRSSHLCPAPQIIPRVVNGSLVGDFLTQTLIPPDDPQCVIIKWAAKLMHDLQGYSMRRDYVKHRIYLLVTWDPSSMMHHVEIVMKCPTIHLGISTKCFTHWDDGADVEECPSHCASMTVLEALPSSGVSYGNGMTFTVTNAWILCHSENSHCEEWTVIEGEMMSFFLMVYIMVLNHWQVPTMVMNFGGTKHFNNCVSLLQHGEISGPSGHFDVALLRTKEAGMHISNLDWRRPNVWVS
jgi:hypothetical protein